MSILFELHGLFVGQLSLLSIPEEMAIAMATIGLIRSLHWECKMRVCLRREGSVAGQKKNAICKRQSGPYFSKCVV